MTTTQEIQAHRDACQGYGKSPFLVCPDCHGDELDDDCACRGTGGVFCMLCDGQTLAVKVDGEPVCLACLGEEPGAGPAYSPGCLCDEHGRCSFHAPPALAPLVATETISVSACALACVQDPRELLRPYQREAVAKLLEREAVTCIETPRRGGL